MRIISGNFKGKKISLPSDKNTRPLRDLVKESIFNLLDHSKKFKFQFLQSNILDLFSGSGSFGLECLSREAKKVVFLENYSEALKILEKNIKIFKNVSNYEIIKDDCFNFFKSSKSINLNFDIIFIDPPYKELKVNDIIEKIVEKNFLNDEGILIIHRHKNDTVKLTQKINVFEERFYGVSKISFAN